jgi:hypothetical protein
MTQTFERCSNVFGEHSPRRFELFHRQCNLQSPYPELVEGRTALMQSALRSDIDFVCDGIDAETV